MVNQRTRDRGVASSIPTSSWCGVLEQETLSTLLSTGFYPGRKRGTWQISTRLRNVLPSIYKVDYYYYLQWDSMHRQGLQFWQNYLPHFSIWSNLKGKNLLPFFPFRVPAAATS